MSHSPAIVTLNDEQRASLVRAVLEAPEMLVISVTGGGVATLADLLLVPGASRTVLDASVPYSVGALGELLSRAVAPELGAVSEETARAMALACLAKAERLRPGPQTPVAGVACTAALVTDRDRRGADRACAAIATEGGVHTWRWLLEKATPSQGGQSRVEQDRVIADQLLVVLASVLSP